MYKELNKEIIHLKSDLAKDTPKGSRCTREEFRKHGVT